MTDGLLLAHRGPDPSNFHECPRLVQHYLKCAKWHRPFQWSSAILFLYGLRDTISKSEHVIYTTARKPESGIESRAMLQAIASHSWGPSAASDLPRPTQRDRQVFPHLLSTSPTAPLYRPCTPHCLTVLYVSSVWRGARGPGGGRRANRFFSTRKFSEIPTRVTTGQPISQDSVRVHTPQGTSLYYCGMHRRYTAEGGRPSLCTPIYARDPKYDVTGDVHLHVVVDLAPALCLPRP